MRSSKGDTAQQHTACARQLDDPHVAVEQRHAHITFQCLDLPADGRLRERQFCCCGTKIQVPGDCLKSTQLTGKTGRERRWVWECSMKNEHRAGNELMR